MPSSQTTVRFGVVPRIKCDCGAVITSEAENLGCFARCSACYSVIALEASRLIVRIPAQFCPDCGYKTLWSKFEGDVRSNCGWEGEGLAPEDYEQPEALDTFCKCAHRATRRIVPGVGQARSLVVELVVDRAPGISAAD